MANKYSFINCMLVVAATISCQSLFSQGLSTSPGSNLIVQGTAKIVINDGGFKNAGTFNPGSGAVKFTGTAGSGITSISGVSPVSFYDLTINKTGGSLKLLSNIAVSNQVAVGSTDVDLNGFDLNLGSTGSLFGENAASQISGVNGGSVIRTLNLNAPTALDPGNIGIEITSSANLGITTFKRGNVQQNVGVNGLSILRYYDIIPANNTLLNAKIKFRYVDEDLAGLTESALTLYSSADSGTTWSILGYNSLDIVADTLVKSGIQSLYRFTLASSLAPLPIKLISFSAEMQAATVSLKWATSFEVNNSYFELQRSDDGRNFSTFAKVNGAGNSNIIKNYNFSDSYIFSGILYYRLKQVDADGKFSFSKIVTVNKSGYTNSLVNVFPNPVGHEPLQVRFITASRVKAILQVTDIRGHLLISREVYTQTGVNNEELDLEALPKGVYYLKVSGVDNKSVKITRQ